MTAQEKCVAMVKPTTHGSGSHDALLAMLPPGVRTETFYCGIKDGDEIQALVEQLYAAPRRSWNGCVPCSGK